MPITLTFALPVSYNFSSPTNTRPLVTYDQVNAPPYSATASYLNGLATISFDSVIRGTFPDSSSAQQGVYFTDTPLGDNLIGPFTTIFCARGWVSSGGGYSSPALGGSYSYIRIVGYAGGTFTQGAVIGQSKQAVAGSSDTEDTGLVALTYGCIVGADSQAPQSGTVNYRLDGGAWQAGVFDQNISQKATAVLGYGAHVCEVRLIDPNGMMRTIWERFTLKSLPRAIFTHNDDDSPTIHFNGSASYKPDGGAIVSYAWTFTRPSTATLTATGVMPTVELAEGAPWTARLTVTDADGRTNYTEQIIAPDTATMSGVAHPPGALYLPLAGSGFSSSVVRLVEGVAPATLGTVPLKSVHLMRHEGILYAGGVASDGGGKLYQSEDEGVSFTMLSQAFSSAYKTIGWCELWGGGFAAIATQTTGLYGAFSLDGQNWSTPRLLYTAPSGTPKGTIRQMTASGESHLIISDAQTYSIRNDDSFATAGTRLF